VHHEVWAQLKNSLNHLVEILKDEMVIDYYLDRDIREKPTSELNEEELSDMEPLLVNMVNTWSLRPDADSFVPNLFFAFDYVRTNIDLPTVEGANEAARRVVNCILDASLAMQKNVRSGNWKSLGALSLCAGSIKTVLMQGFPGL
jgi:uncharacterized protein with NAD-binding domain and iron-sulfur cluster